MDIWEKLAFYPYVFSPLLFLVLIISLIPIEGGLLPSIFILPLLFLSIIILYFIFKGVFAKNPYHLILSFGIVIFTIFFPYLLSVSSIKVAQYTFLYLILNLPLFMGHIYAIIFQLSSTKYLQSTQLIDSKELTDEK